MLYKNKVKIVFLTTLFCLITSSAIFAGWEEQNKILNDVCIKNKTVTVDNRDKYLGWDALKSQVGSDMYTYAYAPGSIGLYCFKKPLGGACYQAQAASVRITNGNTFSRTAYSKAGFCI